MESTKGIFKLEGKVQHYAWGGHEYIPGLLQIPGEENKPYAEYWLGAHPSASSLVINNGESVSLYDLVQHDEERVLGKETSQQFKELPYLFKILDVKDMLSIQVHPSREEAEKGFAEEEKKGVHINAPHRNYKDRNHKPEVMVALSDFWLLHGFKPAPQIEQVLQEVPEFNFLLPVFKQEGYRGLYQEVMELTQQEVDRILKPLIERLLKAPGTLDKNEPGYWAAKLFKEGEPLQNIDRGVFSIYLFNIVHLKKGEAIFQAAGIPHAYLQGQNVELMANSDNVLRGGLTPKHIDVPELLKHTHFKGIEPAVLQGESGSDGETHYPCPVPDFGISAISLQKEQRFSSTATSAEIFLVIEGEVVVNPTGMQVRQGESFIVFAGHSYTLIASTPCLVYKAYVPVGMHSN